MGNSYAQARVQKAVDHLTADGAGVGLQVAVIHRGELVVDVVSGSADIDSGLAVAVMRNHFSSDWDAAGEIDRLVADIFSTHPKGARS